ncbi:CHASE2 domain-containing protein [Hydrogenophaga laconesensis]|uniref:histidine kinase n=1 Tax=Hydrogenophaga laconesensis TaxID=1805971 RepID=A0ABU1VDY4_9BURK|nr:CHASE2 domain-containing protein [Hydrogenophaga laconesensis]MDR7095674.1 CHASE2 domain-containing sensor protein/signal transduction histidine kinase [Hydrogenophaga laconesensis]
MDARPLDPTTSQLQEPAAHARRPRTRWLEWGLLSAALLACVVALGCTRSLEHIDLALGDQLARLSQHTVSPDIVIVAIDDKSLAEIGRWPWRRAFHAAVLDHITAAGPRAVGLDLLMVEPGHEPVVDDALLGAAMERSGKVVLPLMLLDRHGTGQLTRTEPAPELASAAAAIGHVHLEIDNDGIVRSTFLREGDGDQWWDQFAVSLLRVGGFELPSELPGARAPAQGARNVWQRDHWMQIPFAGPPGSFARVSYVDVLKGKVPPGHLAGKYVLVGATAAGMGDAYATPRSGQSELMPGVEIAANVMNALLMDRRLERATPWQNALFSVVPVALALLAVLLLAPTASLLASGALLAAILAVAALAPSLFGLQFAPTAALLGVLLAYPLWVWRRLRAAMGYLLEEFQRMETRRDLPTMLPAMRSGDLLDRHIDALQDASQQLRNLHRFVSETLNSLPDATLIADASGQVLMANQAAYQYFIRHKVARLRGYPLGELLQGVHRAGTQQPVFDARRLSEAPQPWGAEARDAAGRDLLVRFVPGFNTDGQATSWIASLVDITPIREAERQRDVALRFISHDMRSPQTSILALLEVQRLSPEQPMHPDTLSRIERHARRTLELAEEFVQLARAESSAYRMETLNLVDVLDEAVDEVWPQAQARHMAIQVQRPDVAPLCEADRGLLTRAVANLLGNAVKYGGRDGSEIRASVQRAGQGWRVSITDQGPGMTPEQQQQLFQQFARLDPEHGTTSGVGLGLVFVRTVLERHGGGIEVSSAPGRGTTFHFTLAASSPPLPATGR